MHKGDAKLKEKKKKKSVSFKWKIIHFWTKLKSTSSVKIALTDADYKFT